MRLIDGDEIYCSPGVRFFPLKHLKLDITDILLSMASYGTYEAMADETDGNFERLDRLVNMEIHEYTLDDLEFLAECGLRAPEIYYIIGHPSEFTTAQYKTAAYADWKWQKVRQWLNTQRRFGGLVPFSASVPEFNKSAWSQHYRRSGSVKNQHQG